MRILISNDDGVYAPGIRTLYSTLASEHEATIIAPLEERSTTGHSLSLDRPLRVETIEKNIYGCSGFPGDCVLVGLGYLLKKDRPEIVLSGINRGANLGQDLYYSGTIAAAREAAFHGVPSMAVSLVIDHVQETYHYQTAAQFMSWCLEERIHQHCPPLTLLNVNVPNRPLKEIRGCKLTEIGFRRYSEEIHARTDARGRDYFWVAGMYEGFAPNPESDCQAIEDGFISITPHALIDRSEREYTELLNAVGKLNAKFNS